MYEQNMTSKQISVYWGCYGEYRGTRAWRRPFLLELRLIELIGFPTWVPRGKFQGSVGCYLSIRQVVFQPVAPESSKAAFQLNKLPSS